MHTILPAPRFKTCALPRAPDVLTQCRWEQYYVRNSMTRSLIYNYVRLPSRTLLESPLPPQSSPNFVLVTPHMCRPTL